MSIPAPGERRLHVQVFEERLFDRVGIGGPIFNCWDDEEFWPERLNQPRELQLLWAASYCYCDTFNGGFHQFFTNYTGVLAPEAVEGFRMIGLADCAEIVAEAMEYFGHPYPRSPEECTRLIPPWPEDQDDGPFDDLDNAFCERMGDRFDDAADKFAERYL